jgi:hypothetical protein
MNFFITNTKPQFFLILFLLPAFEIDCYGKAHEMIVLGAKVALVLSTLTSFLLVASYVVHALSVSGGTAVTVCSIRRVDVELALAHAKTWYQYQVQ